MDGAAPEGVALTGHGLSGFFLGHHDPKQDLIQAMAPVGVRLLSDLGQSVPGGGPGGFQFRAAVVGGFGQPTGRFGLGGTDLLEERSVGHGLTCLPAIGIP